MSGNSYLLLKAHHSRLKRRITVVTGHNKETIARQIVVNVQWQYS